MLRVETIFNKADYQTPKTCVCRNSNVVTLHCLADEGRMIKVSNSFGLEKANVSKVIRLVTSIISEKLGPKVHTTS